MVYDGWKINSKSIIICEELNTKSYFLKFKKDYYNEYSMGSNNAYGGTY